MEDITPELLWDAYRSGYFPMAEGANESDIYWFHPEKRGVIFLDEVHIPRSLKKIIRQSVFEVRADTDFRGVITACANTPRKYEDDTWINSQIIQLYCQLASQGKAHSIECYSKETGELVGGLYGVSVGRIFCGESMFSLVANSSRVAFAYLVSTLRECGYQMIDTQFANDHLHQFGCREISQDSYVGGLIQLRDQGGGFVQSGVLEYR